MNARAKMSSKGQVVVPKAIRDAHGWKDGTELEWIDGVNGATLRPIVDAEPDVPRITMEEFLERRIRYDGPPITTEDMDRAILEEASRCWRAEND